MKKSLFCFILTIFVCSLAFASSWQYVPVKLLKVVDGNTLQVSLEGKSIRVRLLGINTPEKDTTDGQSAKAIVEKILAGKKIILAHKDIYDAYGRLSGHIIVEGRSLSDIIPHEINSLAERKKFKFVGSRNSNKYHHPSCRWVKKIKHQNIITFPSVKAAQASGYIPCKTCNPPVKIED